MAQRANGGAGVGAPLRGACGATGGSAGRAVAATRRLSAQRPGQKYDAGVACEGCVVPYRLRAASRTPLSLSPLPLCHPRRAGDDTKSATPARVRVRL